MGSVIERLVIRPIKNAAALSIVATFGLSIMLQESVRATFGAAPKRLLPPIQGTVPMFGRSEEHTSELQSLMRISYAVFCLKTKTQSIKLYVQYTTVNYNITNHLHCPR